MDKLLEIILTAVDAAHLDPYWANLSVGHGEFTVVLHTGYLNGAYCWCVGYEISSPMRRIVEVDKVHDKVRMLDGVLPG